MGLLPDDETGRALREYEENGSDLSKPMEIDFFVAVPSQITGEQVAKEVSSLGFITSVEIDNETGEWTCYCTKKIIPEYSVVTGIEKSLDQVARKFGGFIDGFGSYGN